MADNKVTITIWLSWFLDVGIFDNILAQLILIYLVPVKNHNNKFCRNKKWKEISFFLVKKKKKEMVFTKAFQFASDEELTTEECPLGTPYLKAGAMHLGKHCEAQNNEFVLCRHETRDPQSCLKEGKEVTSCANEFFRKV